MTNIERMKAIEDIVGKGNTALEQLFQEMQKPFSMRSEEIMLSCLLELLHSSRTTSYDYYHMQADITRRTLDV